jgi:hypothetical protein
MEFNTFELTDMLEISDRKLNDLKNRIMLFWGNEENMRNMIKQYELEQEETHCYGCDNEGDCFILHGIIRFELGDMDGAIKEINKANLHLYSKDETWNSICGLVLLGMAHETIRRKHLALQEYQKAYHILKNFYLPLYMDDYIEKAIQLEIKLKDAIRDLSQ